MLTRGIFIEKSSISIVSFSKIGNCGNYDRESVKMRNW